MALSLASLLPRPGDLVEQLIRSPLGALAAQPWLDPVGIGALRRWFFPLSRLWAAGNAADGSVDAFLAAAGLGDLGPARREIAARILSRSVRLRREAAAAAARWREALFEGGAGDPAGLRALDRERRARSQAHMLLRAAYAPLLMGRPVAPVRWRIPSADEVEALYGPALACPGAAFAPPPVPPEIRESPDLATDEARERWLRFASPSQRIGDDVYARVVEPAAAAGTLIMGSGVCVESDVTAAPLDQGVMLGRLGLRAVEIVSPWHGLRAAPGWYGGEPFFATAPLGPIDLLTAQVRETAVLVAWCRRRFGGPVAVGGVSMSSLAAQLVAAHAGGWPPPMRPDALLLITHSGRLEEVTFDGELTGGLGLPAALAAAGWTRERLRRWLPLMNPIGPPAVAPERIVSVLARDDRVTPYAGGRALVADWGVPAANLFAWDQGHFSMPLALIRDPAPLRRLRDVLAG